jgi:PHD/YefM family antitoxin component YafN of YafNO toxin-antitoxin module
MKTKVPDMRTVVEKDIKDFRDLLKGARKEPVRVDWEDHTAVVIIAAEDFQTEEERRRIAGKRLMESLEKTSEKALSRPTPTREEMKKLLECSNEEIDNIFGADYFQSNP